MTFIEKLGNKGGTGFFVEKAQLLSDHKRKEMIEPQSRKISIVNQCKVLEIPKSTYYYKQKPVSPEELEIMRQIDEEYLKHPSYGSRSMRRFLEKKGYKINRKRVQRLMNQMGLEAIYPKPRTSIPHPDHKIYPYLLRRMVIDRPNKVWASDIHMFQ